MNFQFDLAPDVKREKSPKAKPPPKTWDEWLNSSSGAGQLVSMDGTLYLPSSSADKRSVKWPNHPPYLDFVVAAPLPPGEETKVSKLRRHDNPGDTVLGTFDEIKAELEKKSPWETTHLDNIEKRLDQLEKDICSLAGIFLSTKQRPSKKSGAGGLGNVGEKAFMTDSDDLLRFRNMEEKVTKNDQNRTTAADYLYPGLSNRRLSISLPGNLEPLVILSLVTKSANLAHYLLSPWKKVFFCNASASLLQSAFWWIWMDYYKPDEQLQSLLFDQIANEFATVLRQMDDKYKDEIFVNYPVYLAQALYSTFCQAFPSSSKDFDQPEFLDYITNIPSEWIVGVKSQPQQWKSWPRHFLNPYFLEEKETRQHQTLALTKKDVTSLVISSPSKPSSKLKKNTTTGTVTHLSRSIKSSIVTMSPIKREENFSLSTVHIGPGPIFECVQFGIFGRSPLFQHYLYLHNFIESEELRGPLVSRTQVKEIPPPGFTYEQVLKCHSKKTHKLYEEYKSVLAESEQDVLTTQQKLTADSRTIEKLNKRILQHRHQVSLLAEKLVNTKREERNV